MINRFLGAPKLRVVFVLTGAFGVDLNSSFDRSQQVRGSRGLIVLFAFFAVLRYALDFCCDGFNFSDVSHFDVAVEVGRDIVKIQTRDAMLVLFNDFQVGRFHNVIMV